MLQRMYFKKVTVAPESIESQSTVSRIFSSRRVLSRIVRSGSSTQWFRTQWPRTQRPKNQWPTAFVPNPLIAILLIVVSLMTCSCGLEGLHHTAIDSSISPVISKIEPLGQVSSQTANAPECQLAIVGELAPSMGHQGGVLALFRIRTDCFGSALLSLDRGGEVLLWNTKLGKGFKLLRLPSEIEAVVLGDDCDTLAFSSKSKVGVFSLSGRQLIGELSHPTSARVANVALNPKADALLFSSVDGNVYRWRFREKATTREEKDKLIERYGGHPSVPFALVYHPQGRIFFSGDWIGSMNAWLSYDVDDPYGGQYDDSVFKRGFFADRAQRMRAPRGDTISVDHLRLDPSGEILFAALQSGIVEIWQVRGFVKVKEIKAHEGILYGLAVSPGGTRLASAGRDGRVKVWSIRRRGANEAKDVYDLVLEQDMEVAAVRTLVFLDDQKLFAGTDSGDVLQVELGTSSVATASAK